MAARHLVGVTIATLLLLLHTTMATPCRSLDSCSCQTPDGSVLDLHPMASRNASSPRFFDQPDAQGLYLYSWNPCLPFNEGTCTGVAVCQHFTQPSNYAYYGLGLHNSSRFVDGQDGKSYTLVYSQTAVEEQKTRITVIDLICDPDREDFIVKGEGPILQYSFELYSKHACLKSNKTTKPSPATTTATPVTASTHKHHTPRPHPPTPNPPPGPPGLYSLRTVVLLLFGIFFCLLLLLALAFIFLFIALIRLGRPSVASGDGLPGKK